MHMIGQIIVIIQVDTIQTNTKRKKFFEKEKIIVLIELEGFDNSIEDK